MAISFPVHSFWLSSNDMKEEEEFENFSSIGEDVDVDADVDRLDDGLEDGLDDALEDE